MKEVALLPDYLWRCGCLMVSGSQLWIKPSEFELGLGTLGCVLGQNTFTVPHSTPVNKMGNTKFCAGDKPAKD